MCRNLGAVLLMLTNLFSLLCIRAHLTVDRTLEQFLVISDCHTPLEILLGTTPGNTGIGNLCPSSVGLAV